MKVFVLLNMQVCLLSLGILGFMGCSEPMLSPDEYKIWAKNPKNGWVVEKQVEEFSFSLFLHPEPYMDLAALPESNPQISVIWDSLASSSQSYQHATFRVYSSDKQTPVLRQNIRSSEEYQMRVNYLAFHIQPHLYLQQGETIIPCVLHHFERSYDLASFVTISCVFSAIPEPDQPVTFIFDDQHFGVGPIKLTLTLPKPSSQPSLRLPWSHA